MQDQPSPSSLLEAVAAFLRDEAAPALPPHEAFNARVSANVLDLARRQLEAGAAEAAERERLVSLLGCEGTLEELTALLARRIEEDGIDLASPELIDHLRRTTDEKIAVDQPKFAARLRRASGG